MRPHETALLFALVAGAAGVAILGLRVAIFALAAWLDRRRARRTADPFPAVDLPGDHERPELICLPGGRGRNGRQVCRRAYPGRRSN